MFFKMMINQRDYSLFELKLREKFYYYVSTGDKEVARAQLQSKYAELKKKYSVFYQRDID